MKTECILAIDQGTTSSRAIVFNSAIDIVSVSQQEFPQIYPQDGWVEHDPEAIWKTTIETAQQAFKDAEAQGYQVIAIGITNQRETTVVWDRQTDTPVYNAIVWQDRRTAHTCKALAEQELGLTIQKSTGLLLDPYFSATKIAWILDHVEDARKKAAAGELAFGTIDSFLIWRLTGNKVHATDATNASRTSLFNINIQEWDQELLNIFNIPAPVLPEVLDCAADYGVTAVGLFGREIPIFGVAGDQQAATVGQCCFSKGMIKSTYGTGCFVLMNTGDEMFISNNRLLSTVAYRIDGKTTYALEGSIFIAGAAVQWLRDGINIIDKAAETESMISSLDNNGGTYMVPAFTGLGAPYWNPDVRGAIFGLNRGTERVHIVRAALESVCYQTYDLFSAMADDGVEATTLRVDGGMVANNWLVQFLADILSLPITRPKVMETTALGAAYLAGRQAGVFGSFDEFSTLWQTDAEFSPAMEQNNREQLLAGWQYAVNRVLLSP